MNKAISLDAGYLGKRRIFANCGPGDLRDISDTPVGDGLRLIFGLLSITWWDPDKVAQSFDAYCGLGDFPAVIRHIDIDAATITLDVESEGGETYLATGFREFSPETILPAANYAIMARRYGLTISETAEDLVDHGLCDVETAYWFAEHLR